ncbi:hypothetical protein Tco_0886672 [Tanacetum coccineum]
MPNYWANRRLFRTPTRGIVAAIQDASNGWVINLTCAAYRAMESSKEAKNPGFRNRLLSNIQHGVAWTRRWLNLLSFTIWKEVVVIHGLTKAPEEDLKACYKRTIDMVKFCYDTTLRPWFKEKPVKCEKTKKVEGGYDHTKEENPQELDVSSKNRLGVVRENTREYFENVKRSETRFGVILKGNNDMDVD